MKEFKYKSICHTSLGAKMYSTQTLIVGDSYDIHLGIYQFSSEYEIYKNGVFYTSFILSGLDYEGDDNFLRHFYNENQMIQNKRSNRLNLIGL